jgi:hypothetical protein
LFSDLLIRIRLKDIILFKSIQKAPPPITDSPDEMPLVMKVSKTSTLKGTRTLNLGPLSPIKTHPGLDRERINQVILEASKDSAYFKQQQVRDAQVDARIATVTVVPGEAKAEAKVAEAAAAE